MTSLSKYRITMNTSQLRNETSQLRNKHVTNLIIEHKNSECDLAFIREVRVARASMNA